MWDEDDGFCKYCTNNDKAFDYWGTWKTSYGISIYSTASNVEVCSDTQCDKYRGK